MLQMFPWYSDFLDVAGLIDLDETVQQKLTLMGYFRTNLALMAFELSQTIQPVRQHQIHQLS